LKTKVAFDHINFTKRFPTPPSRASRHLICDCELWPPRS